MFIVLCVVTVLTLLYIHCTLYCITAVRGYVVIERAENGEEKTKGKPDFETTLQEYVIVKIQRTIIF